MDDWEYWLEDIDGYEIELRDTGSCYESESRPGTAKKGNIITLGIKCFKLPRDLAKGDKVGLYVFDEEYHKYDSLIYFIPIPGYSTE